MLHTLSQLVDSLFHIYLYLATIAILFMFFGSAVKAEARITKIAATSANSSEELFRKPVLEMEPPEKLLELEINVPTIQIQDDAGEQPTSPVPSPPTPSTPPSSPHNTCSPSFQDKENSYEHPRNDNNYCDNNSAPANQYISSGRGADYHNTTESISIKEEKEVSFSDQVSYTIEDDSDVAIDVACESSYYEIDPSNIDVENLVKVFSTTEILEVLLEL